MKKAGIITFYKSDNPGAVLQAYALQKYISQNGYKAEIIQYADLKKKSLKMNPVKRILHNFWYHTLKRKVFKDKKWQRVLKFIDTNDSLSEKRYTSADEISKLPPQYDVYITGSDQVWNDSITGADYSYYLSFAPDNAVKIAYGASCGSVKTFLKNKEKKAEYLSRYDVIAVRETNFASVLQSDFGIDAQIVLDPTLLLSADEWKNISEQSEIVKKDKYILCYIMPGDKVVENGIAQIAEELNKQTGYKIVRFGLKDKDRLKFRKDDIFDAGPAEFVRLIADASFVITNSFHGSVFAVNFGKNLFGIINGEVDGSLTRASRLISVYELLGMNDRLISFSSKDKSWRASVKSEDYNYEKASAKLSEERKNSADYLLKSLELKK